MQEYMGLPPKYLLDESQTKEKYYDDDYKPLTLETNKGKLTRPNSKTIQSFLKSEDLEFVDFIQKCIWWDPDRRLTCEDAFKHPWIGDFIDSLKVSL